MFPPLFFNKAKADSTSAIDPCLETRQRSLRELPGEGLRTPDCFDVPGGDIEVSMKFQEQTISTELLERINIDYSIKITIEITDVHLKCDTT